MGFYKLFSKLVDKVIFHFQYRLFVKQWVVGITRGSIRDIIRSRKFDCDIRWFPLKSAEHEQADPFILNRQDDVYNILVEDYTSRDRYGKIALMSVDKNFKIINQKIILDTQSHLSYPYIFRENGKVYMLPESAETGKLSIYEYNSHKETADFVKDILDLPLLDANLIKHRNKYWILGVTRDQWENEIYEMRCFYSDNLLGPYTPHPANPVKKAFDDVRGAGNIIEVDGELYRPTQNCREEYGKSITINRIKRLDEEAYEWEYHMTIAIDKENAKNKGFRTIHTINVWDDVIVVDGKRWLFSPFKQHRIVAREKAYEKQAKTATISAFIQAMVLPFTSVC